MDQLWQSILTPLFPFKEGYLVVGRDRVVDDNQKSADLMVKLLRHDNITIIFTMENKRHESDQQTKEKAKDKAKQQLEEYLELVCKNSAHGGIDPRGAIAIGTEVSFYKFTGIRTREGPRELILINDLDISKDKDKVQNLLMEIKRDTVKGVEQLEKRRSRLTG